MGGPSPSERRGPGRRSPSGAAWRLAAGGPVCPRPGGTGASGVEKPRRHQGNNAEKLLLDAAPPTLKGFFCSSLIRLVCKRWRCQPAGRSAFSSSSRARECCCSFHWPWRRWIRLWLCFSISRICTAATSRRRGSPEEGAEKFTRGGRELPTPPVPAALGLPPRPTPAPTGAPPGSQTTPIPTGAPPGSGPPLSLRQ